MHQTTIYSYCPTHHCAPITCTPLNRIQGLRWRLMHSSSVHLSRGTWLLMAAKCAREECHQKWFSSRQRASSTCVARPTVAGLDLPSRLNWGATLDTMIDVYVVVEMTQDFLDLNEPTMILSIFRHQKVTRTGEIDSQVVMTFFSLLRLCFDQPVAYFNSYPVVNLRDANITNNVTTLNPYRWNKSFHNSV